MTLTGAIDWGATGAMIGGVGAWAQLLAAIVGVVVAYRLGRAEARAVASAQQLAAAKQVADDAAREKAARECIRLARDVLNNLSRVTATQRNDSGASMALTGWTRRLNAAEAASRYYLGQEGLRARTVSDLSGAQAAIGEAARCVAIIIDRNSKPGIKMGAAMDVESIAGDFMALLDEPSFDESTLPAEES